MIRATMSAHLSETDLKRVSLLLNKRSVGLYAEEAGQSFVVPVMQKTHMLIALSDQLEGRGRTEYSALELQWHELMRRSQNLKLTEILSKIAQARPPADMLMLVTEELTMLWQDRRQGVYLLRDAQLFRLQPTQRSARHLSARILPNLDLYAFKPRKNDLLLCLEPAFIEAFDAQQLEAVLSEDKRIMESMQSLIKHLQTYQEGFDLSWIAFEISHIESNTVYLSNRDDSAFFDSREDRRQQQLLSQIKSSKASRVIYGQRLILPDSDLSPADNLEIEAFPDLPVKLKPRGQRAHLPQNSRQRNTVRIAAKTEDKRRAKERREAMKAYRRPVSKRDKLIDRVQNFTFDPMLNKLKLLPKKLLNLFPESRALSLAAAGVFLLLILTLLMLLFLRMRHEPEMRVNEDEVIVNTTIESIVEDLTAIPPDSTNLELTRVLKSNNLQIRQKPDASSALIATAQRGDRIVQLAEVSDGWVYVRLADSGTEGYAFAEYLLSEGEE